MDPCITILQSDSRPARETLITAAEQIEAVLPEGDGRQEVVGDKGYHSNQSLVDLEAMGVRSYISAADRGRRTGKRKPEGRAAVYRNRRRIRGPRGLRLLRLPPYVSRLTRRSIARSAVQHVGVRELVFATGC